MSNYIVRDIKYLWKWAWTYFPLRLTFKPTVLTGIIRRAYWAEVIKDGWFLGWPMWFGKRRGKG